MTYDPILWFIVGLALGGTVGFVTCALLTAGQQGDEQLEQARLRQALREAHRALLWCADHADVGSSEALAAAIALDKGLETTN